MFDLFHKEGVMVEEANKAKHGKRSVALFFQTLLIIILSEILTIMILSLFATPYGKVLLLEGAMTDQTQLMLLFLTIGTVIAFLMATRLYYKRSYRSLGLQWKHAGRQYLLGLAIGFAIMSGAVGIAYLCGALRFDGMQDVSLWILGVYFIGFMIQGFSEELMMRGFFMNAYAANKGMMKAIIFNSVIFAVLHLGNDGISFLAIVNLILAGIVFSLMAVYFDNIIVCSAAHSMWNFAQGNLFGILVSGLYLPSSAFRFENHASMGILNGGSFGLEGGIAVTLVEIVCILFFCFLYKRKNLKHSTEVQ